MITIHPSQTADTRTCDFANTTKDTLLASSVQHISDVGQALAFFAALVTRQAVRHDTDKLTDIDGFHADFLTGFKEKGWWDRHRTLNRHHLQQADGVPADVNLIDVLDFIADCVMAGMARSGSVYPLNLSPELLERAFQNTVALLKREVVVEPVATGDAGAEMKRGDRVQMTPEAEACLLSDRVRRDLKRTGAKQMGIVTGASRGRVYVYVRKDHQKSAQKYAPSFWTVVEAGETEK